MFHLLEKALKLHKIELLSIRSIEQTNYAGYPIIKMFITTAGLTTSGYYIYSVNNEWYLYENETEIIYNLGMLCNDSNKNVPIAIRDIVMSTGLEENDMPY